MSDYLRSLRVPTWCPFCEGAMMGKSTQTYYNFGVCVYCFIEFIETREEKWKSGWRPSSEEKEAYLSRKSSI